MKRHHWLLVAFLVVVGVALFLALLILTAPPAIAPSTPQNLDDETLRVAKNLFCPVCPGVPLDVCDTQACQQWRALIRQKLAAGESEEQIDQYFVQQYGERVLGAPRPQGFNLIVYAAPLLAIVVGGGILYVGARRWVRSRGSPTLTHAADANRYRERIERELKETE